MPKQRPKPKARPSLIKPKPKARPKRKAPSESPFHQTRQAYRELHGSELVYIEWNDASVIGSGDWLTLSDISAEVEHGFINRTVGWVVYEGEQLLIIAAQKAIDRDPARIKWDLVMGIPKSLIRVRKVVKI